MKKLSILLITLCTFMLCITYSQEISAFVVKHISKDEKIASSLENNSYAGNTSYDYVKLTNDFSPKSKKDIVNIYYTVLNSGMESFTFYCSTDYKDCIDDVDYLSNQQLLLSNINNFVPVYNSFQNIETEFDSTGKVTISIKHNYTEKEINELNKVIENVIKENIQDNMKTEDKIKIIHNYIINNTKYDINRSDNKVNNYHSDSAYGALIEHYAICGGYADSMKLFLDRLNIPNYKISSENHIWNLVNVDNNWYHLDLTWDDPITSNGTDVLEYDYFLITTTELEELESDQHNFDIKIYKEAS